MSREWTEPDDVPVTTGDISRMLKMDQQTIIRLATTGVFEFWWTGAHRKFQLSHILGYAERRGVPVDWTVVAKLRKKKKP